MVMVLTIILEIDLPHNFITDRFLLAKKKISIFTETG
jgi:hypothetical protein